MHEGVQVSSKLEQLQDLLAPVVVALGYQCWGIDFSSQGKHSVLRIYIDKEGAFWSTTVQSSVARSAVYWT